MSELTTAKQTRLDPVTIPVLVSRYR